MKLTIPDLIVKTLSSLGVDHLFHVPGTSVASLYNILAQQKKIKSVLFKHEQAACFAAAGYTLATNRTGVCMVMCGPGVTNVVSALTESYYQSIPQLVITVDNPKKNLGLEDFHEVDSFSMLAPVTKKTFIPQKAGDVQQTVVDAFRCASQGRPGPVYLNIPAYLMDQTAAMKKNTPVPKMPRPTLSQVRKTLQLIKASQNPIIFAGSGVIRSNAEKELAEFIKLTNIPIVTTLGGRGAISETKPMVMGTPSYTYDVSFLNNSDLFIVLGTRLNPVNLRMGKLKLAGKMVQVDTDKPNPKFKKADAYIQSDIKEFLTLTNKEIKTSGKDTKHSKSALYQTYKKSYQEFTAADYRAIRKGTSKFTSKKFLLELSSFLENNDAAFYTDSIWLPYSHLLPRVKKTRSFSCMRSFGCLGFALPSAIGACLSDPRRKVISLSGDGAFLFNCQDLSTVATYGLNNFIQIVLNNSGFASLHNIANSMFPKQDNYYLWNKIDFNKLSESFGIKTITVDAASKVSNALTKAFKAKRPCLLNIITDDREEVKKPFWIE
jgi:acetolactate synthase-1/2/3 large subunit